MPLKTSSFNKELLLQAIRSVGWVSIVYFLGLMIALPVRMMMTYSKKEFVNYQVNNLFGYDFAIQIALLVSIPVLMAVFLFRFLHVNHAADLMHSLPIRREKIFHHYALLGIVLLIIPVVLIALVVMITHTAMDLNLYFDSSDVLYWLGVTILFNVVFFTAGVFVAMMTGISAVQAVLTYIFLFFPVGITLLTFYNLRMLLYGFPSDYLLNKDLDKLSPITYAGMLEERPLQWDYAIFYFVLAVILYGFSVFFYKKRKIETASEAIAFSNLRAVFKYGVTFCMMLFGGVYFRDAQNTDLTWIIFGYILGASIGYFIAEMVLQKTWRVVRHIKGLTLYSVIMVVLIISIQSFDIYENAVPEVEDVNGVLLAETPIINLDDTETYADYFIPAQMKNEENIKRVQKLHEQIIADKKMNQKLGNEQYETAFFMYTLKNGDKVARQYRVNKEIYEDYYRSIYESEEYKRTSKEIFKVDASKVKRIIIGANGPIGKSETISKQKELKEALQALKDDVLNETYEDGQYYQDRGSSIEIVFEKDRTVFLTLKPTYENFSQWLAEKELLENVKVTADDIDHIIIAKMNLNNYEDIDITKEIEKAPDKLKITDKDQIEQCINQSGWSKNHKYSAVVYFKDRHYSEVFYYDEEHAPNFMKEHFE